ncbi:MAG: gamma carbonic anhydrase family protein [Tepidiformaceae bacterium]
MIRTFEGKTPQIADSAFVSEAAYVVGDVVIGERSSVWPGAVIRADFGPIRIGANTHVEDNVTVHYSDDGMEIGDHNIIGHNVVVHCKKVGSNCLLGNNSILLDGAVIGDHCVIAAGAVVPPRTVVPDWSLVMGVPGVVTPLPDSMRARVAEPSYGYADMAARHEASGLGDTHP